MQPLFVIAEIKPKPEHFEEAVEAVAGIMPQTRDEPGCRDFRMFEQPAESRFFLFEEWDGEADLAAHYEQPYTKSVFENYAAWLSEEPIIHKLTTVR